MLTLPHFKPTPFFLPPLGGEGRGGGAMNIGRRMLNRHPSQTLPIKGREQVKKKKKEPLTLTLSPPRRGARGPEGNSPSKTAGFSRGWRPSQMK